MSSDNRLRLARTKSEAKVRTETYRFRLVGRLWWANRAGGLTAALATAATLSAADKWTLVAAWLAGSAPFLTAIYKALNVREASSLRCLHLNQAYHIMARLADSALSN